MKVSIVTISFNQGPFLEACIRSVLEQDYSEIEYIVVDAGSIDGSRDIISRYVDRIAKVVLEQDAGPADGLNKGFALATGDIFGFVNADDVLLPGAVSNIVAAFRAHPSADVIYGHGLELDARGDLIQRVWSTPWNLKAHAYRTAVTVQPSTFFSSKCFRSSQGFNVQNRTCWDAEFFVDLAMQGARFEAVQEFIGAYRMYPGTVSSEVGWGARGARFEVDNRRIFEKIMGRSRVRIDFLMAILHFVYKQFRQPRVAIQKFHFKLNAPAREEAKLPPTKLL
jgi:glycosyltransferase involved in cell wall biosynthesis